MKIYVNLAVVVAILCSPIRTAIAQPVSQDTFVASALYSTCTHSVKDAKTKQDDEFLEQTCTTYLRGLTDALFIMQLLAERGTKTCLPTNEAIGIPEARGVFQTYLQDHPESAANSAGLVASMALVAAHKCQAPN